MSIHRRQFITSSLGASALLSLAPAVPRFLLSQAQAAEQAKHDRVLVVVQLNGGNDGLNTVVPYGDDEYYKNRFTLAVDKNAVRKIDDRIGFHPSLGGFSDLLEAGQLSVIQGVGYPNPDRSHFSSMDVWNSALREPQTRRATGWLGRYLDQHTPPGAQESPALHLGGDKQPLALAGEHPWASSLAAIDRFRLDLRPSRLAEDAKRLAAIERPRENDLVDYLQQSMLVALATSDQVRAATDRYSTPVSYPGTGLAQKLRTIAQLIDASLKTRIYYVMLDGFDTHSEQGAAHANLLGELGGAMAAFVRDLDHHGHAKRVAVLAFSEFGRRVRENGSQGTDHGAAAPVFLAGGGITPGVIGKHPSLTDLDDGDLKFHTDFRQIYAALLTDWLGVDSGKVLGGAFPPLPIVRA